MAVAEKVGRDTSAFQTLSLPSGPTAALAPVGLTSSAQGAANQQLKSGVDANGQPLGTAQTASLRDFTKEAAMAKSMGGNPKTPQETAQMIKATYSPDIIAKDPQLSQMVAAGQPQINQVNTGVAGSSPMYQQGSANAANPAVLKQLGYTDAQIAGIVAQTNSAGQGANMAQNKLNSLSTPTNMNIRVLENALNAKNNVTNQGLGESDLFKQAGLGTSLSTGNLMNSLGQRQQEMQNKYDSFKTTVSDAAAPQLQYYQQALDGYKATMDQYRYQQDRLDQINKKAADFESSLQLQKASLDAQAQMAQKAREWETSHRAGQYIQASADNGYQSGVFDPSSNTFKPTDNSGHTVIPGYLDQPMQTAGSGNLGSISGKYESGNDYSRVSSGAGDAGGISYGAHQFSRGNITAFVKASGYGDQFAGMTPGSADFTAKWKQLAKGDPNFNHAQDEYIAKTHYQPLVDKLTKAGIPLANRGQAVQELIYSTGVQYGPGTNVIQNALKGKDVAKMSDEQILTTVQNYKADTISSYFSSSSKGVQNGVKNRTMNELKDLLHLASQVGGDIQKGNGQGALLDAVGGAAKGIANYFSQNNQKPSTGMALSDVFNQGLVTPSGGPNARIAPASQPSQSQSTQQPQGPVDENGQALNSTRVAIRNGTLDQGTVDRYRAMATAAVRQGNPQGQSALDQLNADVLYAKQHPPLTATENAKYSQAMTTLNQSGSDPTTFLTAYATVMGLPESAVAAKLDLLSGDNIASGLIHKVAGEGFFPKTISPEVRSKLAAEAQSRLSALAPQFATQATQPQSQSGMVKVQGPDGKIYQMSQSEAQQAAQSGGKILN